MNRKKTVIISALSVALFGTGVGAYQLGSYNAQKSDNSVSYVKTDKSDSKAQATAANKTPDQISKEEGISAEQIVVKITDDGYVTSHGDHYHYYNGKVPYDAIISEELIIKDPSYVFNKADVINEVKDGYIIKVNGKYYLYLKEGSKRTMFVQRNKSKSNAKNGLRVVLRENQESIVVQKLKLYQPAYVKRKLVVAILQMMVMFLVQQMSLMTWEMPF